ncbi:MAG: hypothetical protein FJ280_15865 [Planctomycetes bacterium]|nr:hypothetical protein [Planctomycetota bacterium]
MSETRHIEVVEQLVEVFDSLGIAYAIGGSLASSAYGASRFTQDADIVVQPFGPVAERFYDLVKDEFYISAEAMRQALTSCGSFNVIHFKTSFKIDIFIQGPGEFEKQLLARRRTAKFSDVGSRALGIVSPEDIILLKLRWFRETGGTSDRQWSDVLGVLAVQGASLDFEYLTDSARKLGLGELLERARAEADT